MSDKPMSADEVFVNLIAVAQEDPKIRAFITQVVSMGDFDRLSLVNTFIKEMAFKGAPAEFIKAIAALRDPVIASKVKELLQR